MLQVRSSYSKLKAESGNTKCYAVKRRDGWEVQQVQLETLILIS